MSAIGPGNIGSLNLAGSFAGAQRTNANTDRNKADSAAQKFKVDQKTMSAQSLDDVAETDLSAERDADGHRPWDDTLVPEESAQSTVASKKQPPLTPDAFGERGATLDLEA